MQNNQLDEVKLNQYAGTEMEIDLVDLFFMLLSKLKWIVLIGILGGLIGAGITHHFLPNQYEATSKIYIVSTSSDSVINLSDLQLGTSLTSDYQELLMSRPMLESIQKNLNLNMNLDTLSKAIDLNNPSGTRILTITAKTTDPLLSRNIANEMATLSKTWLSEIMDSRQPNIVEKAVTPENKCGPSLTKNTLIGAMALVFVYLCIVITKYVLDDTIHTSEDMERYFGLVPMAIIPEVSGMPDDAGVKRNKKHNRRGKR